MQFSQTVLNQPIQFSISKDFVYTLLDVKTFPFQIIQFSISKRFSSIWPTDRTISSATTPGQCGPGSDGIEGVLCIRQSSCITGTSDCFVSYPGHSFGGRWVLPLCRGGVSVFYSPSQLGKIYFCFFVWWHINLCRLCNAKAILAEEQQWYYLNRSWGFFV